MSGTNEVFSKNPNLVRLFIRNRVFLGRDLYVPNFNIKIGGNGPKKGVKKNGREKRKILESAEDRRCTFGI
jgi:hypothetical protein